MRLINLDQLKQNLCGDCAMNFPKECRQIGCAKVSKQDILEALRLPIVDVEPVRHGKWTRHTLSTTGGYGTVTVHQCSECESMTIVRFRYCPNCGAKMDAERKEE